MIALVDLDGVSADWGFGYDEEGRFYGLHNHGGVPYRERPGWDLRAGLTEVGVAINDRIMTLPGFYRHLPLIEGAKDAIMTLALDHRIEIYFVSTPYLTNPTCASDKIAWVNEHFGQWGTKRLILTTDKTLVRGDVLIDDKPSIRGAMTPTWKHLCFGEYGYSSSTLSERVKDWHEVQEALVLMKWEQDLLAVKAVG